MTLMFVESQVVIKSYLSDNGSYYYCTPNGHGLGFGLSLFLQNGKIIKTGVMLL